MLTLKANLHYHSTQTFDKIQAEGQEIKSFAENIDLQHGRIERRKIEIIDMPFGYLNGISSKYAKLPEKEKRRTRLMAVETENVLMITSLEKKFSPEELLKFNKSHWSCENNLHWIKDKVFEEDKSTISTGEAPLIIDLFRNSLVLRDLKETRNAEPQRTLMYVRIQVPHRRTNHQQK
ncbi:transposase [Candidatus Tisiphia endosymbiont of Empis tessellata]|uniref:transposase n=1 Tax=Candidatus Tisiphia endosymbiont of Empis tessellata TaxID=3066259 RepID=UPI00313AD79B